jgi:hypothetical protein
VEETAGARKGNGKGMEAAGLGEGEGGSQSWRRRARGYLGEGLVGNKQRQMRWR